MKFTRLGASEATTLDGIRYGFANLFNAFVLLLSFGQYSSDAVWKSSLKMAQRYSKRREKRNGSSTV